MVQVNTMFLLVIQVAKSITVLNWKWLVWSLLPSASFWIERTRRIWTWCDQNLSVLKLQCENLEPKGEALSCLYTEILNCWFPFIWCKISLPSPSRRMSKKTKTTQCNNCSINLTWQSYFVSRKSCCLFSLVLWWCFEAEHECRILCGLHRTFALGLKFCTKILNWMDPCS